MFHTPATRSGQRKRPGYQSSNNQILYNGNGTIVGSSITYINGALTGNGYGLTVNAQSGIVSNTTGVFANLGGGLGFVTGAINVATTNGMVANSTGLWLIPNTGITTNTSGIFGIPLGNNGIISNSTGLFVNADASFTVNSLGLHINATGALSFQDLTLNGNLAVLGTLTTINTQTLAVNDNFIEIADNQAGTTTFTDAVDMGIYGTWGNTQASTKFFGGLARLRGSVGSTPSNTNPYFVLFGANTDIAAGGNITTPVAPGNTGFLQSFLVPYGIGGAFVVNATNISITAGASQSVAITSNSLTLTTTPLAVSNIAAGTDGQVLQFATGSGNLWGMIDGGTFAKDTFILNTSRFNRLRNLMRCESENMDLCTFGTIENLRGII